MIKKESNLILMQACKEITKITNYKCRHIKTNVSFEVIPESEFPVVEIDEDENESVKDIDVKSLIKDLGINEIHCRIKWSFKWH